MALSFEESLKRAKAAAAAKQAALDNAKAAAAVPASYEIAVMDMASEPATLAVEDNMIAAYSGDDWTLDDNYLYYQEYHDDKMSYVDENKKIKVNESQINLTQEKNSQFVPFEMPRFYDGFDLRTATVLVYFVNEAGAGDYANPINMYYSQDKLRFGWLIDDRATVITGKLHFEIQAIGVNSKGDEYIWKTQPNDSLEVLQSLSGDGVIEPDTTWLSGFMTQITEQVALAQAAANEAKGVVSTVKGYSDDAANSAAEAQGVVDSAASELEASVQSAVDTKVEEALVGYYTSEEVDELIAGVDVSDQLNVLKEELQGEIDSIDGLAAFNVEYDGSTMTFYNGESVMKEIKITSDPTAEWTTAYTATIEQKISAGDKTVSDDLAAYKEKTDADLAGIHDAVDALPETLQNDYYNKAASDEKFAEKSSVTEITGKIASIESTANTNKEGLESATTKLLELDETVAGIDKSPRLTYNIDYNNLDDPDVGENQLAFFEYENEGQENEVRTLKKRVVITGGSGGGTSSTLKIEPITPNPYVVTADDTALLTFNFSGVDSSGNAIQEGTYTVKIKNDVLATGTVYAGENTIDVTDYLNDGSQTLFITIVDYNNTLITLPWRVQKIDLSIKSSFDDSLTYTGDVSFSYTPYGAISKEIHFKLDGEELESVTTSASGIQMGYTIPTQKHGSHLLEVWSTADISNNIVPSNHIVKDILFVDPLSVLPVIGCTMQDFTMRQYDTTQIRYVVYDPTSEMPKVKLAVDGKVVSEPTLETAVQTWAFKSADIGEHTLTITCGETVKTLRVVVEKLEIDVIPVTAGLAFDFNPVGYSNGDTDGRIWSDGDVTMIVTDNFDWVNGGYQLDENGNQYFCVKAGTRAVINYNLFADDPKKNGKEFKAIFRTRNIRKRDTSFLTCMNDGIGLDMKVEHASVHNTGGTLKSNYCEDVIIEYEFNINKDTDMMIVMSYEDGTPSTPYEYTSTASFKQSVPQPITIGSDDCDVLIYRIKAYSTSLTDTDIKNNFIADAPSADEMIARYTRNQIYNDNNALVSTSASGGFSAEAVMKTNPELRYIFLEVPQFTNDKDNKIDGCTVYFRYPNGKRPQDNWDCTGMRHRGQGTSSNLYGDAGRNIDLCMDRSSSLFTWKDENGDTVESDKITLTDTSIPTNYLNVKVKYLPLYMVTYIA